MNHTRRRGKVYINNIFAGVVKLQDGIFSFKYDNQYILSKGPAISLTLPVRTEPYEQKSMIAFFDGLIPEGWLLNIVTDNWKINPRDRMSLLLLTCHDCIGNIHIIDDSTIQKDQM